MYNKPCFLKLVPPESTGTRASNEKNVSPDSSERRFSHYPTRRYFLRFENVIHTGDPNLVSGRAIYFTSTAQCMTFFLLSSLFQGARPVHHRSHLNHRRTHTQPIPPTLRVHLASSFPFVRGPSCLSSILTSVLSGTRNGDQLRDSQESASPVVRG